MENYSPDGWNNMAAGVLSLKETAAIAHVDPAFVRKEVERSVVRPKRQKKHLAFPETAPLYFALIADLVGRVELTPTLRTELYRLVTEAAPSPSWHRENGTISLTAAQSGLSFDIKGLKAELARRLRVFRARDELVHSDPAVKAGTPVFRGTRIPLDNVRGQLARGATHDELVRHYPGLDADKVLLAELLNRVGRRPGRPKKIKPLRIVRE
jgi:uncharacterized protein (DUF433 family)